MDVYYKSGIQLLDDVCGCTVYCNRMKWDFVI